MSETPDNPDHGTVENPITTDYNTENLENTETKAEEAGPKEPISEDFNVDSSEPAPVEGTAEGVSADVNDSSEENPDSTDDSSPFGQPRY